MNSTSTYGSVRYEIKVAIRTIVAMYICMRMPSAKVWHECRGAKRKKNHVGMTNINVTNVEGRRPERVAWLVLLWMEVQTESEV